MPLVNSLFIKRLCVDLIYACSKVNNHCPVLLTYNLFKTSTFNALCY